MPFSLPASSRLAIALLLASLGSVSSTGQETDPNALAEQVLEAAGGKDRVLLKYRFVDRLRVGEGKDDLFDPLDKKRPRESYVEAPLLWWLKKKDQWVERGKEPAKWLAYGWSLGVLCDPEAEKEALPDKVDEESKLEMVGLRVTGAIKPAMDLYFDKETLRLVRIDWTDEICRFSEWKPFDGFLLASRCVGYRRDSGAPWYVCEIDEVERVKEIPDEVRP